MDKQINIPSQLNPDIWDHQLVDYWDKQLLLLRFGFPFDYDRKGILISHNEITPSAKLYPGDIQTYLDEEIIHKAILGPFQEPLISHLHMSPVMTRDKHNAAHCRVIIDLTFHHGTSVHAGVSKDTHLNFLPTPFLLKLPIIDPVTDQINALVACSIR